VLAVSSTVNLLVGSSVSGNTAGNRAGGLFVQESTLVVSNSKINNNVAATGNGGGMYALSFSTVHLQDIASVSGNTVAKGYGGGLHVQQSTLVVSSSKINNNVAVTGDGGGVHAHFFSTVHLRDNASVSGNTAVNHGGGLYVRQSTLTSSKSAIDDNTAGADGGGVRAQTSSTVTLGDGASVSRNTARGNGGGLSLLTTSSLATAGRVSVRDNAATGSSSVGGGIAASTSTVRLGSGSAAEIAHNRAAVDGGALALSENSTLADSGDPAFACLLTVHHNTASKGSGGGLVVSGDSSVTLAASTAVFSQNTAAQQGGGLFIRAGQTEFDKSRVMEYSMGKVTFWRLDLVGNTATTGDGGGDDHFAPFSRHQMIFFVQEKCILKTCSNPN
jgi:predicted outer membrane repeat protein